MKTRRDFLKMTAATAAGYSMLPPAIARALQLPANRRTGTIEDVEHVVILMQENRSFDHYFGTMRGVRGFGDPRPALMPNGKPVWHQPVASVKTKRYHSRGLSPKAEHVLPFYINPKRTTEFQAGTDHGWSSGHLAWNEGRWNEWVNQKQDVMTMGYLRRQDVSFHYALADAFTLCDGYFCSVHANTCPNRIYLWSGTIDAENRYGKRKNGPGLDERHHVNGYTWTTYPERLQKAGISWKLYQGGSGEPDTPVDNYTDNSLEFFAQYHVKEGADPKSPLVQQGVTDHTLREFREDVAKGRLSQVSWIVPPYKYSEHPEASPTDGAYYLSLVMDALTANPEVWSKTAFLINYDENDGLFDHIVPPMPPKAQEPGRFGMVSEELRDSLRDEFVDMDKVPGEKRPLVPNADPGGLQPIGLGPRVPLFVVSPWSTGGYVCSQVFDHTSVLQFLEKRFGIEEPNISKWRRAVCGDLTSAFDFSSPGAPKQTSFPAPQAIKSEHQPYSVPEPQTMPVQEKGSRPARALPYEFWVDCHVEPEKVWVELSNHGHAGAAFYIYDRLAAATAPRRYTVSAGDTLRDFWAAKPGDAYHLAVYGPNGYMAELAGKSGTDTPEVALRKGSGQKTLQLAAKNALAEARVLHAADAYTGWKSEFWSVAAKSEQKLDIALETSSGWFDVTVRAEDGFLRRFAGHLEDGKPSVSDPLLMTEA
ncbi:phosphocholine-specific phospholipase C [Terriglobus tenax]|uniref:phosphocholine-specific phospholipase C n=1 Tax=Terriglobus tenax TaxID=1111115 RepID=UPI0021DFBF2B|nr:phospholipase C, phosphocholine-specific [Terriglobus tenax]